jgi:hypothetical protein
MRLTMDITPTQAITMMDRASISVDTITSPAVSKAASNTGKPGFEPGFSLFKAGRPKESAVALVLLRYLEQARSVSLANAASSCRINRRPRPIAGPHP